MGVGGQRHALAALPQGKSRYTLYRRLDGYQDQPGRFRKNAPPTGIDPWTVQPVASRYTDKAIPTHVGTEGGLYVTELQESSALRVPCGPVTTGSVGSVFEHKLISGSKNKTACETGHLYRLFCNTVVMCT